MVHKMQRLAMSVSDADTSSMLPTMGGVPNRQKCATIVEEAEIDYDDDHHGDDGEENSYGTEGRAIKKKKITTKTKHSVCVISRPRDCQISVLFEMNPAFVECIFIFINYYYLYYYYFNPRR